MVKKVIQNVNFIGSKCIWIIISFLLNILLLINIYALTLSNIPLFVGDMLSLHLLSEKMIKIGLILSICFTFILFLSFIPVSYTMSIKINNRIHYIKLNVYLKKICLTFNFIKIIFIALSICLIASLSSDSTSEYIPTSINTIAHAMGGIDNTPYTNSLDAFEYNYASGTRYFEIDFSITKDGHLVLWHDWGYSPDGIHNMENIPTKKEFKNIKLLEKYTALSLDDLKTILKANNDVYFITDSKETSIETVRYQFEQITSIFSDEELNHFIPQFYSEEMFKEIDSIYHFPSYIFTLYQIWDGNPNTLIEYCRFCIINNIDYLTMPYERYKNSVIDIINNYKIKVWLHTVNDIPTAKSFFTDGARGVYTDFINNKDI